METGRKGGKKKEKGQQRKVQLKGTKGKEHPKINKIEVLERE